MEIEGPDMNSLSVQAASPDFAFDMDLIATGPLVFHGENGFSQKSAEGKPAITTLSHSTRFLEP